MRPRPFLLVITAALAALGALAARPRSLADVAAFAHPVGEAWVAQLQCLACHEAPQATAERVKSLGAPSLAGIAERVSPAGLRHWLGFGHAPASGSRMPDLLHDLAPQERADAVEDLTHFLATLGAGFQPQPVRPDAWQIEEGARWFTRLACAACHSLGQLEARRLDVKFDHARLSAYLRDPLAHRPAGGMPDFGLDAATADALAAHLLRAQFAAGPTREDVMPGVRYEYREYAPSGPLPLVLDEIPESTPVHAGLTDLIALPEERREERFHLYFEGWLSLERAETVSFGLNSDDGSRLQVDGEIVVNNDGHHAPQAVEASAHLAAGLRHIEVEMFEADGGETLEAWIVRGGKKQALGAEQLVVRAPVYAPLEFVPLTPDPARVARGLRLFEARGCAS